MDTKQKILDQARDSFMELGIRSVSMDDLSSRLGISKKTIYQYVVNKQDLVNQIITRHTELERELMQTIKEQAGDAIDELVHITQHISQLFRTMRPTLLYDLQKYYKNSWQKVKVLHQEFIQQVIKENLVRGISEGYYRREIDVDIIARLYVVQSQAIIDEQMFPLNKHNSEHLIDQLIQYHLRGILSEEGSMHLQNFSLNINIR